MDTLLRALAIETNDAELQVEEAALQKLCQLYFPNQAYVKRFIQMWRCFSAKKSKRTSNITRPFIVKQSFLEFGITLNDEQCDEIVALYDTIYAEEKKKRQ